MRMPVRAAPMPLAAAAIAAAVLLTGCFESETRTKVVDDITAHPDRFALVFELDTGAGFRRHQALCRDMVVDPSRPRPEPSLMPSTPQSGYCEIFVHGVKGADGKKDSLKMWIESAALADPRNPLTGGFPWRGSFDHLYFAVDAPQPAIFEIEEDPDHALLISRGGASAAPTFGGWGKPARPVFTSRVSLSWSRLAAEGFSGHVGHDGQGGRFRVSVRDPLDVATAATGKSKAEPFVAWTIISTPEDAAARTSCGLTAAAPPSWGGSVSYGTEPTLCDPRRPCVLTPTLSVPKGLDPGVDVSALTTSPVSKVTLTVADGLVTAAFETDRRLDLDEQRPPWVRAGAAAIAVPLAAAMARDWSDFYSGTWISLEGRCLRGLLMLATPEDYDLAVIDRLVPPRRTETAEQRR